MMAEGSGQIREESGTLRGEETAFDLLHNLQGTTFVTKQLGYLLESGDLVDEVLRLVSLCAESVHFVDVHSEEEEVLRAHFLPHLHVGAIESSDRETSVQLQISHRLEANVTWNFMSPVPDASVPAVEICSLRSAAGMIFSARETR